MLQSTYKWKSALAILYNQQSFVFVMLKNKSFSSFQQQTTCLDVKNRTISH